MRLLRHLNQGTAEWLHWRQQGLGGSDVGTLLGVLPFDDATEANLFREKVEGWRRPRTFAMQRGCRLEPAARSAYMTATGTANVHVVCVEHDRAPWMRVSLDGLIAADLPNDPERLPIAVAVSPGRGWRILELKAPNFQAHDLALEGIVPVYYRPQCQWQLLVCGLDRLDYASYSENERFAGTDRLAVVPVAPDAEMQARLLEAAGNFWRRVTIERAVRRDPVGFAEAFSGETD